MHNGGYDDDGGSGDGGAHRDGDEVLLSRVSFFLEDAYIHVCEADKCETEDEEGAKPVVFAGVFEGALELFHFGPLRICLRIYL